MEVIPARLRPVVRFAAVGVVNTGVYYGTYLLLRTVMHYLAAHLSAIAVAMVVSFFLNCYWTFRTRPTWRKFALWPLTNATNYVMTTVGVVVLVEWVGLGERIAPLVAAAAAIPVTYLLSRRLLAGRRPVPVAAGGEDGR
ncbi:GtrA family protein [Geodermatophilus sabuli]|uniref:Putative flippase GtrA (Transmembrane translocase of bactoprenol-linked glucose) n=1 Tax=Geodermatophilus sabuli TaxID=1564158 RepID=A0A285EJU5_9ACTN|nr:GtrA family protein [Geodermatophilus sabuli]MBB3086104.1 putative flippase GtrA [Geodermatophilus sabuli]SNX98444.1 Putative flippase GtrA (transmembrane translocase of bactoprenol-linked glucose) [Geodermatophilus sabuli]